MSRTKRAAVLRTTAALAMVFTAASIGAAEAATRVGWVWADQPNSTVAYTPLYSYNSAGGAIKIRPQAVGVYEVDFNALYNGSPDNIQVSAYGTSGWCMSDGWTHVLKQVQADVKCYNANGALANNMFTLLYQSRNALFGSANRGLAFLRADEPKVASYTPNAAFQYNSTGAANTIVRNGVGNYSVTIPGLTKVGGNVQVTAWSGFDAMRCKVGPGNWTSGPTGTTINVVCFNKSGVAHDEYFTLAYALNAAFGLVAAPTSLGAYGLADQPTNTSVYTLAPAYQYNGFGTGSLTGQKTGKGLYTVQVPGTLSYISATALVTATGSGSGYCNIINFQTQTLHLACYAQGGGAADSTFGATFQTAQ